MTNEPKPQVPDDLKQRMQHLFIPMQELIEHHKGTQNTVLHMLESDEMDSWMPILECHCQKTHDPNAEREVRVFALNVDFNEPQVKQKLMLETGASLFQEGVFPVAITISSEAWTGRGKTTAGAQFQKDLQQNEIIQIASLSLDQSACLSRIPIERDKSNRMIPNKDAIDYYDTSEGTEINAYLLSKVYAGWALAKEGKIEPSGQFHNQKVDVKGTQND